MRIDARWVVAGAILGAALNFIYFAPRDPALKPPAFGYDFRALYCVGAVGSGGADPYRTEPLRTCERNAGEFSAPTNLVVPEPLPGYGVALFGALARLPPTSALVLWTVLLVAAFVVSVVALGTLTDLGAGIVAAALELDVWSSLVLGQIAPLLIATLAICGLLLERRRYAGAAVAGACTLIEPHIGIAVCVALAFLVPGTRIVLGVCVAALVAISLIVLGPSANLDFLLQATTGQIRAEAIAQEQYSLTYLLTRLGIGQSAAIFAGSLWYAAMVAAAILVAQRLAALGYGAALVAFVPAAAAVFGGPYVHLHQIAVAVPAALLLTARTERYRAWFAWAVVLLAIPWGRFLDLRAALLFVPLVTAVLAVYLCRVSAWRAIVTAAGAAAIVEGLLLLVRPAPRMFDERLLAGFTDPASPAYHVWAAFLAGIVYPPPTDAAFLLSKLPTFAGLILLMLGAYYVTGDPVRFAHGGRAVRSTERL